MNKISRALISVSDKSGIVEFVKELASMDIEILSTGGTATLLSEKGIAVTEVAAYTGFPEIMDGRVKTLHPKIHGGLLGRRGIDEKVMAENKISPIDLVVVNLYPFEKTVARDDCDLPNAIENIDIGGPTMLRAAAKNYHDVTVVVDAADYRLVLDELKKNKGATSESTRFRLAVKVFEHTTRYDSAISNYLSTWDSNRSEQADWGGSFSQQWFKKQDMRYGENPHQSAAFYVDNPGVTRAGNIGSAEQIQGKELSFNNISDTDAALECVKAFEEPACVIVKHANPCGVAIAENIEIAYDRAFATDPTSAFGGIIAFNRPLDSDTARAIIDRQFVEVIIAPRIEDEARIALADKKNVRVLECGHWDESISHGMDFKRVVGGLLIQQRDTGLITESDLKIVTKRKPSDQEQRDLLFSWKIVKFVKSNAIVYCRDGRSIGIGAGQMSRVYSARIAGIKAADEKLEVKGSVMASDAFFPFRDGLDQAAEAGITAVIQPGGSMRDEEVIAAADEHDIAMVFTGMRHFRH